MTVHCRPATDAPRSRPRLGRATLTTVVSSSVIDRPSTAVSSTQRPDASPSRAVPGSGRTLLTDRTPVSQRVGQRLASPVTRGEGDRHGIHQARPLLLPRRDRRARRSSSTPAASATRTPWTAPTSCSSPTSIPTTSSPSGSSRPPARTRDLEVWTNEAVAAPARDDGGRRLAAVGLGPRRRPRRHVHASAHRRRRDAGGIDIDVHGERARDHPPRHPADRERRLPAARRGLPPRGRADRARRAVTTLLAPAAPRG